ncbi:MAG: hypothetical protein LRY35_06135 [Clostridiales bacterium]|nr:hypothetical protein [Clostridiales bacterium]
MVGTKVLEYLESGNSTELVRTTLSNHQIEMISINDVAHVERTDDESISRMLARNRDFV